MSAPSGYSPPTTASVTTPKSDSTPVNDGSAASLANVIASQPAAIPQPPPVQRSPHPAAHLQRSPGQNLYPSDHMPRSPPHMHHSKDHDVSLSSNAVLLRHTEPSSPPTDHSRSHSTPSHGPIPLTTPLWQGAVQSITAVSASAPQHAVLLPRSYSHSHLHDSHGVLRPGPVHWAVSSSEEGGGGGEGDRLPRDGSPGGSGGREKSWVGTLLGRVLLCSGWSAETKQELRM